MVYANIGRIKDPLKQYLLLEFSRNQNKDISILIENQINYDEIRHIRNNWLNPIIFCPRESQRRTVCSASFRSH